MKTSTKLLILFESALSALAFVFILYKASENIVHYHNKFVRRFAPHTAEEEYKLDLKYDSFYFAGSGNGKIYLGNYTAPLRMTVLDTASMKTVQYQIQLTPTNLPFKAPCIKVVGNDFFVYEGASPYIFKGKISDWKARMRLHSGLYFSYLEPVDSTRIAARFIQPKTGESILGVVNLNDTLNVRYNKNILQKQFDGIFDTDGSLMVDHSIDRIIYCYRYRNQYSAADTDLKLDFRGNTIDTVSQAHLKVTKVSSRKYNTLSEPPLIVNKVTAVDDGLLFVNSVLPGIDEPENLWNKASIVDVYDLKNQSYQSSFAVYKIGRMSMRSFLVSGNHLFALIGDDIVCYLLRDHMTTRQKKI